MTAKYWLPISLIDGHEEPPLMRTVELLVKTRIGNVEIAGYLFFKQDGTRWWKLGGTFVPDGELPILGWHDKYGAPYRKPKWGKIY